MEENYLIGLVIAFLFSFVILKKDGGGSKSEDETYRRASGSSESGVAKYLRNQEGDDSSTKVTGVAKYLQEKELLHAEETNASSVSSVAKYLASKAETPISGVSKYMARQVVQSRKIAKENISGVEKYLNNQN